MAKFINKLKLYCLDKGKTEEEFNSKVQCQNDNDGKGDWISRWDLDIDKPTDAQLDALSSQATTLENNAIAVSNRQKEYGSLAEQLEYITENGLDAWQTKVQAIKTKYPKESE